MNMIDRWRAFRESVAFAVRPAPDDSGVVQIKGSGPETRGMVAKWQRYRMDDGFSVAFDGFHLSSALEPTPERIRCLIEGFRQGYLEGKSGRPRQRKEGVAT